MTFTEAVNKALSDKKMSKTELAKRTNYSTQYIIDLIKGNRRWNEDTMSRIGNELGIKIRISA